MVKKNKIVIDSNIFVNALFGGLSKRIFGQIDSGESELVISEDIFAEYSALVEYPEIKNNIDSLLFYSLLYEIHKRVKFSEPKEKFNLCRDKEDNKFLEVAYTSKADCLITFDKDLLELRNENKELAIKEHKFKILKPIEFLKIYASK